MRVRMTFYNKFNYEWLGDTEMNWDRNKSINGWYSSFWKNVKLGLANLNKIDKRFVGVIINFRQK